MGRFGRIFLHRAAACGALAIFLTAPLVAGDWAQWRGPNRDGKSAETGLLESWPKDGPRVLWTAEGAGKGYSGVAVVDGRVFTMGSIDEVEKVIAYSLKTGKVLWEAPSGSTFQNDRGSGPRSTPTTERDVLYALGANGDLVCLKIEKGRKIWHVNIVERFGVKPVHWGMSESVLVEGDTIICNPGGEDASVVALNKKNGATVWTSKGLSDRAGYASAVAVTVDGVRQIIHFTSQSVVGLRAADGSLLWQYKKTANGTANCTTPIVQDRLVFLTSGYGQGCALLELSGKSGKTEAREVYFNKVMQNHHGSVILVDGSVYGYSSRDFVCLDLQSGTSKWSDKGPGKCSITFADGHLYCLSQDGTMTLVEANPEKYVEKSRFVFKKFRQFKTKMGEDEEKPTWAHPVVSHERLFLRDEDKIYCYDIAAGTKTASQ